jgi:demethylmenaquinone methyltransferase/2-methoxy-6-polyprenyl-1,4-benzoquinol methylase
MQLTSWSDFDPSFIRHRYNRIANFFLFFEWLFLLPPGIRNKAVNRLQLSPGDSALEIGCGTGRNLHLLRQAVGPDGHVYGVDVSEGMLGKASERRAKQNWENVTLTHSDALNYTAPEEVDAVLFSLSYATMPHHKQVLAHAWNQLKPGKNLIIMDAKLPSGILGKMLLPYSVWVMRKTVLGNPLMRPWEELHELTADFRMEEVMFGTYYVCAGRKPLVSG